MLSLPLLKVKTKLDAALFISERLAAGHSEISCKKDADDWLQIADACNNQDELEQSFNDWLERGIAWELRTKGMLH